VPDLPGASDLSEGAIRELATPESFARGQEYVARGAVLRLTRRGDRLEAEVEGSQEVPYRVSITLRAGGVAAAECSCPYDWGGVCKHVVAALLAYLRAPGQVEARPDIGGLLEGLDRAQLQAVLVRLVEWQPDLADVVESHVQALRSPSAPAGAPIVGEPGQSAARRRRTGLDPAPFRRRVRAALRSLDRLRASEAYWQVGAVADEVRRVLEETRGFVEGGDARDALTVLEAVTEEYVAGWTELDHSDGEASGVFADLGALWTEAILAADLTAADARAWAERLAGWQEEVGDYGVDEAFDAAQRAALERWDDPRLQRVLRGQTTDAGAARPPVGDALTLAEARLRVLQRQGRTQEYLNLAAATGLRTPYTTMLVHAGRVAEAVDYGLTELTEADEALALAQALRERGATAEALAVAEHGLHLEGQRAPLARWLRDRAAAAGQPARALEAALVAVHERPNLSDYQAVRALAGDRWPELRTALLARLRREAEQEPEAPVEIFLHEGLVEEAIGVLDAEPASFYHYALVERVAEAAVQSHPEWVIRTCRQQAERIMDEGNARHYHHAAGWLENARAAYLAGGREAEWGTYLDGLLARHKRKYSLVPLLKRLAS
jgi:uncharacterized Zn finger protein